MNTIHQSKLKMYLTVRICLLAAPDITAKLPNFSEFLAALDAAIIQIQANSEQHQFNTKGVTDKKSQLKDSLITSTADASAKMQAYCKYIKNTVLLSEIKFTKTSLLNLSSLDLVDVANGLSSRIDANLDEVTLYGLTAATQTAYKATINAYAASIPQPRQTQLQSKEMTLLENQGIAAADEALDSIDSVVEIMKLSEPNFYTGYRNARKIIEMGTGSLQVQGIVTEAETEKPIPNAILRFCLTGDTEVKLEKETAAKGGFNIKSLAEGIYDITVTKVGFQPQTITVIVRWDELCSVQVALEKV